MKKVITSIFITLAIIILGNISNASSDFTLNSIDYNVSINEDGSMQVNEIWTIKVHSMTNTLFKTFALDSSRYSGITDVMVSEIISNGTEIEFIERNEEVLHVDTNCYYGLVNSKGKYEIAWGINERSGTKKYKIAYKVNDCIKKYNDIAELYWQFIGKDFEVDVDNITGTIEIPNTSLDKKTTRAWAHGPLNGNIIIESASKVKFDIEYLDAGNYLEVRLAMPAENFTTTAINENRLDTLIEEETKLAEEANIAREEMRIKKQREEKIDQIVRNIIQIVGIIISVILLTKISKYSKVIKENPKIVASNKSKYYRDIPNENATPAEAAFLYYFGGVGIENNLPNVLSSTMLDLSMKKFIEFEIIDTRNKKEQIKVKVLDKNEDELKEDEKEIYDLLKKIQGKNEDFNMKELEKYAKKNYSTFLNKLEKIKDKVKKQLDKEGMYDIKIQKEGTNWGSKAIIYVLYIIGSIAMSVFNDNIILTGILIILSIICIVMCSVMAIRRNGLTQNGVDEREKWQGLKRYMEDYSMIDDREVPELVIWEKYLVYATAFGIADKVLKQLKVQYPELEEGNISGSTYLGMMYYNGMNTSIINSINRSVSTAYSTGVSQRASSYNYSNSSSGGGFGGGFSGGGGGGAGRRWRRRKIKWSKSEKKRVKVRNKTKMPHKIKS